MARDLRLQIDGDSKGARRALDDVADESDRAAKEIDHLGEQFRQTARTGAQLERQLDKTRRELKDLNEEYAKSGDPKVLQQIQQQYTEIDKISKLKKRIAKDDADAAKNAANMARAAKKAAEELKLRDKDVTVKGALRDLLHVPGNALSGGASALSGLTGAAGPIGTGALIAGATAGLPVALAAGGGAALAGGALGAVGGGVAGAAMGPQGALVTGAWDKVLGHVKERFLDSTTAWVNPTLDSIGELDKAFEAIPIEQIFGDARKYLEPLTKGVAGLLSNTGSGLDDFIRAAGPVVDMLSRKLPELGHDFGDSLRIIGAGAPGAAAALGDVLTVVGGLTKAFAGAAAGAGQLYEKAINTPVLKQGHELFMGLFDFADLPQQAARTLQGYSDSASTVTISAEEAKAAVDALTTAFQHQYDVALGNLDANVAWEAAVDNLAAGFHRQKDALDAGSDSGRKNIALVEAGITAAKAQYDAAIKAGDGTKLAAAKATLAYQDQIKNLEDMLVKLGLSRDAAHNFLVEFGKIDGQTATATVIVDVSYQERLPKGISLGNLTHHAAGGTVQESGLSWLGERGPEIKWLNRGEYISTAAESKRLVQRMMGGSHGSTAGGGQASGPLEVRVTGNGPLAQVIQAMVDRGEIQLFDGNGNAVRARR